MAVSEDELAQARRWAAGQCAKDAALRIDRLADSLDRLIPTMYGIELSRTEAAVSAYRTAARMVREEGGVDA